MNYIGEHLVLGQLGHFFVILSFISSLIAVFAYVKASQKAIDSADYASWKKLGRLAFWADAISVVACFILLYLLIRQHRFEYFYVYKNSGKDLEPKYIFSSLWSASEGSFLLWAVWHGLLGLVVMYTSKRWEPTVMAVISFMQACLATMLAGIYFFDWKMGSSPFALFRNEKSDLPLFGIPDYVNKITDGNGLNQLLQNYWMVIHPPVLFLGFASMLIPFAFAIAGLYKKTHTEWIKPALPWALFCATVLGIGVMMGGAWAYESLSFGGYWAWDPVENASLVPWMVLISGIHTLLIYKHTGRSLRATYLFFILAFVLIIYSTFLTRSGILGDTSVHSFADLGMNFQLLIFLLAFTVPAFTLFFFRYKKIPALAGEEQISSREFWMYIGALVFFFSAAVIIGKTSLPVYNKILGTSIAAPEDVEYSYNNIMVWVALIIALLTAITQYLKYKNTARSYFFKKLWIPTAISMLISAAILWFGHIEFTKFGPGFLFAIRICIVASVYAVVANGWYLIAGVKGKLKFAGPSIAHVGFGLMLLGILISSAKKEVLSHNIIGLPVPLGENENPAENLTLLKDLTTQMGKYKVTYNKDSVHPKKPLWYYFLNFEDTTRKERFTLKPNAFVNYQKTEGLMANPDAKHYWDHDIFIYITSLPNPTPPPDTATFKITEMQPGDSVFYSNGFLVLNSVNETSKGLPEELFGKNGKLWEADIKVYSKDSTSYNSRPKLIYAKNTFVSLADTLVSQNLTINLGEKSAKGYKIGIKETESLLPFVTLKAYKFPYINLLWLGTLIMAAGTGISAAKRWKEWRKG